MDVLDGVPKYLLGYKIKTRTQIVFTFLIPASLELLVYLIQILADIAVTIQHFRNRQPLFAGLTLTFICLPSLVCFISIMTSPWQWPERQGCNTENLKFFLRQLFNLLLFPIGALYRFCRRIFWSIESLFYEKESYEREHSVSKAAETSPFELYHFVQAYTQAAPQIILQLYILLLEDIFRNYETTNVQILSVVFSLINLATITMSYQRFESQRIVGRHYPWSSSTQIKNQKRKFHRTRSHLDEIRDKEKNRMHSVRNFPENEKILRRFHSEEILEAATAAEGPKVGVADEISASGSSPSFIKETNAVRSEVRQENEKHCEGNKETSMEHSTNSIFGNVTDDEKLNSCQKRSDFMDEVDIGEDINAIVVIEEISLDSQYAEHTEFDTIPDKPPPLPAPPPPPQQPLPLSSSSPQSERSSLDGTKKSRNSDLVNANSWQQYLNNPMKRLSTIKDMMVMNAELYIKEHVPHPPRILVQRTLNQEQGVKEGISRRDTCSRGDYKTDISDVSPDNQHVNSLSSPQKLSEDPNVGDKDTTDFFLPTRRRMIKGVEQDDFIAKFVSFFGWIMFIFMRMIALSVFSYFYLKEFLYLLCAHYVLMLICLIYESRLKEKIERILFYIFLAYVYVFVILEFRIKFKHLRLWYFGYFTLVMLQNFLGTILWYTTMEFDSWCFGFLFDAIIASGLLCLSCMIVYYCILKPNDVILLET